MILGYPIWKVAIAGAALLLLIVLGLGAIRSCQKAEDRENANYVNQGVVTERDAQKGETINAVRNANDARTNPSDADLNRLCDTYDRNCPHGS